MTSEEFQAALRDVPGEDLEEIHAAARRLKLAIERVDQAAQDCELLRAELHGLVTLKAKRAP